MLQLQVTNRIQLQSPVPTVIGTNSQKALQTNAARTRPCQA